MCLEVSDFKSSFYLFFKNQFYTICNNIEKWSSIATKEELSINIGLMNTSKVQIEV